MTAIFRIGLDVYIVYEVMCIYEIINHFLILYTADKTIQVKVIFAVVKQVTRLQRKPRKNSEAPMGFEPITIFMVSETFLFYVIQ